MNTASQETVVTELSNRRNKVADRRDVILQDLNRVKQQIRNCYLRSTVLSAKLWSRRLVDSFGVGRWLFVVCGPVAAGALAFIIYDSVSGVRGLSSGLAIVVTVISAALLGLLLKTGDDGTTARELEIVKDNIGAQKYRKQEVTRQLQSQADKLQQCERSLRDAREKLEVVRRRESREHQLRMLYQENWKVLRDVEFEKYLERVFRALGYTVETTAVTGDQGVDLVVSRGGVRTAIQVKGYHHAVGNAAVQQAYAGMAHYGCDACAVITNSRFSNSAVQLAASTNCTLIHEENFRDFVLGRIGLNRWSSGTGQS